MKAYVINLNHRTDRWAECQDLPDEYYRVEIHPRGRSYICNPMVAYQRASHSDIMGTMADYHDIFEHSNSLLK